MRIVREREGPEEVTPVTVTKVVRSFETSNACRKSGRCRDKRVDKSISFAGIQMSRRTMPTFNSAPRCHGLNERV